MEGATKLRAVTFWNSHVPTTPSGSRAPTKPALRSELIPSTTPKLGTRVSRPDARSRKQGRSAPRCSPARLQSRGWGWGCGSRKRRARNSELLPARRAATAPQTQPDHQADLGGHPSKHNLGLNLRRIYTDGADRSGDKEKKTPETMGTLTEPAVVGKRESRA